MNEEMNRKNEKKEQDILDGKVNQLEDKSFTKKKIIILSIVFVCILIMGILSGLIFIIFISRSDIIIEPSQNNGSSEISVVEENKEVQIFKGNDRPIAVMIDNEKPAWPHAGLNDAYLLYEITIEGGESRIMALFKGVNTEKIGPVRSARHYFLDYVQENDAMYIHFGWSPQAQSDISKYKINNINGVTGDGTIFWREGQKLSYHNAFTSINNILDKAYDKKYETKSNDTGVFKYSINEVLINNGTKAHDIKIKYSSLQNVEYKYNMQTKLYERYQRGEDHRDRFTNEFFVAKNIIVCYIDNGLLDDPENKGRQELYNIGTGEGIYITNGEYQNITWVKTTRNAKTRYLDLQGEEIVLNDGITWVQIIPKSNRIEIN